ncbi:MAG TPA: efflux RND transporter periplasmic adaptor subunit [Thermodesulfobacteriota bacterium]|nr:efflux RND transporter periplasmic adaptor subunit [Thermodesulfobacteriota bacterium]
MKRSVLTALAAASLLAAPLFLGGCGERVKPGTTEVQRPVVTGVETSPVRPVGVTGSAEMTGTVKARTISNVASKVMGAVTSIVVREGDRVKKGELLLTIDDGDLREKVRAAEAGRNEAQKAMEGAKENLRLQELTYERYKKLYEGKAVSEQEFDIVTTRLNGARFDVERAEEAVKRAGAGVNEARVYRSYARVVSPVNGVVAEKKVEVGSMASPGMPLIVIEDTSSFLLEANADERLSGKIKKGMKLQVTVESLSKTFEGRVTEVLPSVDPASRTFLVKIGLKGDGLRSGQYGTVSFPVEGRSAIVVPRGAVVVKGQLEGVYAVDASGVVTYRLVRTGEGYGTDIEILSGISPGEKIIVKGVDRAVDGGVIKTEK